MNFRWSILDSFFFLKVSLGFKNISFPLPLLPLKTLRIWSATQNAFKTRHKVAAAAAEEEEEEEEKNGTFFCGAKNKSDANGRGLRVSDVRAPVAKRRGRRFAARRFVLLGRFLLWCRERKKKIGRLGQMRLVGVDATAISERGKDFGESGRPTKRTMRWWSPSVEVEASPRGGFRCHFSFSFGALSGKEAREACGCTTSVVSTNSARSVRRWFLPAFFLRTLPTSQRTDDNDAFFSHSSTGYRSRSWRPQQKDEAHQAKV